MPSYRLRSLGRCGAHCTVALVLLAGGLSPALAQTSYPARSVQGVVGFPAGGNVDVMARTLVAAMSVQFGQQFVVVNRDGASGTPGFGQVAAAKPDGYLPGVGPTPPISIAPHLIKDIKYGVDSFDYIGQSCENVLTVAVPAELPHRNINELLAVARAAPGKLSYGHSGVGTVPHLSAANLAFRTGADVTAIAYRGEAPMRPDLIAGRAVGVVSRNRATLVSTDRVSERHCVCRARAGRLSLQG